MIETLNGIAYCVDLYVIIITLQLNLGRRSIGCEVLT
jgi:hypothetical protein